MKPAAPVTRTSPSIGSVPRMSLDTNPPCFAQMRLIKAVLGGAVGARTRGCLRIDRTDRATARHARVRATGESAADQDFGVGKRMSGPRDLGSVTARVNHEQ
ncbi:hypothetical protein GCM10018772_35230 [Streptomyces fumanus]|uniref:Uncharacterized protein n=1 Tax=Streptomyces fumanus TaxID=67302 RepID=A0A919E2Y3_9ACTN|nr:hypothetical protein GCM10018772_35230 [Streptomyces fumanus]